MENGWIKRNKWIFFVGPLALAAFVAIGGEVVMHLWNWLVPALFGWRQITFWQALGLLVLSRILFGNLGGGGGGGGGGGKDHSKCERRNSGRWERMSPDEREKFRQDMRSRCGGFAEPASENEETA
jgi:hypothetical protein